MFFNIQFNDKKPFYIQIEEFFKGMIEKGMLRKQERLPSTRELSEILKVSRNTVVAAYELLEKEGMIYTVKGKGAFVSEVVVDKHEAWITPWEKQLSEYAYVSEELDIVKHETAWKKGMISFKSISPDPSFFPMEEFRKSFLNRMSLEGEKLLNYGYAQGYKGLIEYLLTYLQGKGINTDKKTLIITNGFTEGFDLVLTAVTRKGDKVICENPTHNTAIKLMKLHELEMIGVAMGEDGIDIVDLKQKLAMYKAKIAYLVPSYHNPTGITLSPEKRKNVYEVLKEHKVPVIEDGFNEELRFTGGHVAPIAALDSEGNSVIYIGSFSKILFPGLRIGWVLADRSLINYLESIKRSRNIHTSFLDQGLLYEYLSEGHFEKYLKRLRSYYRSQYEYAVLCAKKYIPFKKLFGEGGNYIFLQLEGIDARMVLDSCSEKGVIFMPGDIFYINGEGRDTLRLGFSRVTKDELGKGFDIIGKTILELEGNL